jgi:hypothetical protein
VAGKDLHSAEAHIELRPWGPAVDLPLSNVKAGIVELPTLCGKHVVHYPYALVTEAALGRFYAFATSCECPMSYLIRTEPDGAHCVAADTAEVISELYERELGDEYLIKNTGGGFVCRAASGLQFGVKGGPFPRVSGVSFLTA